MSGHTADTEAQARAVRGEGGFVAKLRAEAHAWSVPLDVAKTLMVVPIVGGVLLAGLWRTDADAFLSLIREDSVLEWSQVVGYTAAFAFAVLLAHWLATAGDRVGAAAYVLLAVGLVFVIGEELSWGQRLLNYETPAPFVHASRRSETAVHSIPIATFVFRIVLMCIGVYGTVISPVLRLRRRPTERVELLVPPVFLGGFFLVLLAYNYVRFALNPNGYFFDTEPRLVLVGLAEWMELCFAFGLALFTGLGLRRRRRLDALSR